MKQHLDQLSPQFWGFFFILVGLCFALLTYAILRISESRNRLAMALNKWEPALEFQDIVKGFFYDGRDHTRTLRLLSSDYDRYQRDTTDADLLAVLKALRSEHPERYAKMMSELNAT